MSTPPTLTPDRLESELRSLSPDAFRQFVAAIWERRGWTVTSEGARLLATGPNGDRRRLLVWTDGRSRVERLLRVDPEAPDVSSIDAVVTRTRDASSAGTIADVHEAAVIDSSRIHDWLLYAIDREDAREICRTYFDREFVFRPNDEPTSGGSRLAQPLASSRVVLLVGLVVVMGIVATGAVLQSPTDANPLATEDVLDDETDDIEITPVGGARTEGPTVVSSPTPTDGLSQTDGTLGAKDDMLELEANRSRYLNATADCSRSPGEVVKVVLAWLRFGPVETSELDRLGSFAHEESAQFQDPLDFYTDSSTERVKRFQEIMFAFEREIATPENLQKDLVSRNVIILDRDGLAEFQFRLARNASNCWKVLRILQSW